MKNPKYLILLFIIIIFCSKNNREDFLLLEEINKNRIKYFFSFPDNFIENDKIKKEILTIINNTKEELYIFCYELNEKDIIYAIKNKIDQGINVNIIASKDQNYDLLNHLNIPYKIQNNTSLQHIKLILSDKTILFSGTGNFTKSDIYYNANLFFTIYITKDIGELIIKKFYFLEYEPPIIINSLFYKIKILKSPENGNSIQSIINNSILHAQNYLSFFIFSFYDPTIMYSLFYKSNSFLIKGIIDKNSLSSNSLLNLFLQNKQFNNLLIFMDNFEDTYIDEYGIKRGGKLHHKTIIIDNILLTGSYNFSINARDNNNEIFFWIYDPLYINFIKKQYENYFQYASFIFPENLNNNFSTNDTYINEHLCQNTEGESVYFQNKNAFFYMDYITEKNCSNRNPFSSGIVQNKTDYFLYTMGYSIKNFKHIKILQNNNNININNCNEILCDICETKNCEFFILKEWNNNIQYFKLDFDLNPDFDLYIWNGKNFFRVQIINRIITNNDYYYFFKIYDKNNNFVNSEILEGILFLTSNNNLYFSCFYQNTLRKNLKTFLNLMEWYNEKFLNLTNQCYIIP